MKRRLLGAWRAYDTARHFGVRRTQAIYRALRYAVTGRTGQYRIAW